MGAGVGGDDLVVFERVRMVRAAGSDVCCRIAGRSVWLPRRRRATLMVAVLRRAIDDDVDD
jgi:hypothetical protein